MRKRKKGFDDLDTGSESDSNLAMDLGNPLTATDPDSDPCTSADLASGNDPDPTVTQRLSDSRTSHGQASSSDPNSSSHRTRHTDTRSTSGHDSDPYLDPLGSYLIIKPVDPDVSFRKINVWAPPKQIEAICGPNIKLNIKALRDGSLLIKTNSSRQSRLLLKQKTFCLKNVTVSLHQSLNQAKGTIFAPELKFMSEEELLNEMRGENVTHVRRITTFRDGQRRDTSLLVVTFNYAVLPLKLVCGYLSYDIRPFVPNPLRCFSCQKFGHGKNSCKQAPLCPECAKPVHEGPCQSGKKCVNCKSSEHGSNSKNCPKWKTEKKICETKVFRDVSYAEARKLVETETSQTPSSYASVTTKTVASIETQTDPVPLPPLKLLPPLKPVSLSTAGAQTSQGIPSPVSQPQKTQLQNSGASARAPSRGRSPSKKSAGARPKERQRSTQSHSRNRSPGPRSDGQTRWSSSSRPPSAARVGVGPPIGQGQFFSA